MDPYRWDESPEGEAWQDGQHGVPDAPTLDVEENPEIGRIYGPDGALISVVRVRDEIPFGFGR